MAGTILENLSGRKLAYLVTSLLICQVICFLIGGLIAPAPSNVDSILATKCLMDRPLGIDEFDDIWHIPRGNGKSINCKVIDSDLDSPKILNDPNITPNHLVFAFQAPLPKDGMILDYSRWMATLNAVLQLDIAFMRKNPMEPGTEVQPPPLHLGESLKATLVINLLPAHHSGALSSEPKGVVSPGLLEPHCSTTHQTTRPAND
ncbi:protein wntless-like [Stegodyphus dumicola]|uniref:protein wntless-like n=1 Tax=Stegodyphus dumicola TaxID=202533 RepID=UPI0015AA2B93|nr:protein wntless-like [Stegodyphus dumicola]